MAAMTSGENHLFVCKLSEIISLSRPETLTLIPQVSQQPQQKQCQCQLQLHG